MNVLWLGRMETILHPGGKSGTTLSTPMQRRPHSSGVRRYQRWKHFPNGHLLLHHEWILSSLVESKLCW